MDCAFGPPNIKGRVDAFLDFFGGGYVELAVTELGVPNTAIAFAMVDKFDVKAAGSLDAADVSVLSELANPLAAGELEVPNRQGVSA